MERVEGRVIRNTAEKTVERREGRKDGGKEGGRERRAEGKKSSLKEDGVDKREASDGRDDGTGRGKEGRTEEGMEGKERRTGSRIYRWKCEGRREEKHSWKDGWRDTRRNG